LTQPVRQRCGDNQVEVVCSNPLDRSYKHNSRVIIGLIEKKSGYHLKAKIWQKYAGKYCSKAETRTGAHAARNSRWYDQLGNFN
jgi:hypothetical protein